MKKIKFAVIGAGHIGKRHAEMVLRNPNTELVALCDVKPSEELGIEDFDVPFYSDHKQMLGAENEIDVVCICTPNGLHSEMAIDAINANNHVVIEKPIGLTKAQTSICSDAK